MRRFIMSLSVALVVLLGLVAMMGRSTAAQDATPAGTNPSAGEQAHSTWRSTSPGTPR